MIREEEDSREANASAADLAEGTSRICSSNSCRSLAELPISSSRSKVIRSQGRLTSVVRGLRFFGPREGG